ncbi:MAG: HAD family phosphatase [Clostridia bacterium]|nr:HAD family phosphatase [Clostridia bacterium]
MRSYLFDFDGTLVDSMPTYVSVMRRVLEENGVPFRDELVKLITPFGYVGTAKYYVETLGVEKSEEELIAAMHRYAVEEYTYRVPPKEGLVETMRLLKERGDDLNILTASPHAALDPCLKRLGIYGLFTNIWSCEDFGTTKSDPEIYRMVAKKIGVPIEEIIFVDDNYNADRTAKSAGMTVYGIFDESSREYEQEIRSVTDGYLRCLGELIKLK